MTEINPRLMLEYLPVDAADFYAYHIYRRRITWRDLGKCYVKHHYF